MNLDLDKIMPLACDWVQLKEKEILEKGMPLTKEAISRAEKLGVKYPDKIRIMLVDKVPLPDDPMLKIACQQTNLISNNTAGLTLRYGIYIRKNYHADWNLLSHELVHVSQYERLGDIEQFLKQYLIEVITIGYTEAPMEQEAIRKARG